jgi:hypothetical protein
MTKTQSQKLEVPFHRLTEAEIRQWYKDKLLTTAGYLLAIKRVTRPPGSKFVIPNVLAFCQEWGISKSAFYRAVDELKQKGYQEWEATHGIVLKDSKKIISFPSDKNCPTDGTGIPQVEQDSHERDTQSHEREMNSHKRDAQSHERENQSPEPIQAEDSSSPQTNQTYTDFIHTLSEGEREIFLDFGRKKAANLPHPPELPDKWITANFTELYKQFLASSVGREAKQEAIARKYDWENDPRLMDWLHKAYWEGHPWAVENEFEREERLAFLMWAQKTNAYAGRIADEPA